MSKEDILYYSRQDVIGPLDPWFEHKVDDLVDRHIFPNFNEIQDTGFKLEQELKNYKKTYNIKTAIVGLSGGVDSALTAAMFKNAGWDVHAVLLPIHQNPEETKRALETADALKIKHIQIDLTKTFDKLIKDFKEFDDDIQDKKNKIRSGNLRVRLRMMTLYNLASKYHGLVASTDNFSELAAGFWTLHGDVGDLAPIQSLSKSWEVPRLADNCGIPRSTVFATPTDGLGISKGDEDQFGFSYLEFDSVLLTLCHSGQTFKDLSDIHQYLNTEDRLYDKVNTILARIKNSTFKRQNPCNLKHPALVDRYEGLFALDNCLKTTKIV